jgi:hypothetical protein
MADGMIRSEPAALGLGFRGQLDVRLYLLLKIHMEICHDFTGKKMVTAVPDLRDFTLDRLAELGASPLGHSIALYRERLKESGIPVNSFRART